MKRSSFIDSRAGLSLLVYMQELSEARSQLSAEQGKVFKLEVELAEARQKLQGVAELERELSHYRFSTALNGPETFHLPPMRRGLNRRGLPSAGRS